MMNNCAEKGLTLFAAQKIIAAYARKTEGETVALEDALFRVPVHAIPAMKALPGYDQSGRDGFVVSEEGAACLGEGGSLRIAGEIRAGTTDPLPLQADLACRIMTGGLIPACGSRVIPQEVCLVRDGMLSATAAGLGGRNRFIFLKGSEIGRGRVVVAAGEPILPEHLVRLAATGHARMLVHRRPRVLFACTGSELVDTPDEEKPGLKVSGNRYLLNGLIRMAGGIPEYRGTVADSVRDLALVLGRIEALEAELIITTGGMGPGKYDLVEQAFTRAGGVILYRSLQLRPGKATLFGLLGQSLFFGLPGPPAAISALFPQLIEPALLRCRGVKTIKAARIKATLQEPVAFKEKGVLRLKGGVLEKGLSVRPAGKSETAGCQIFFPAHRLNFKRGDVVEVQPLSAHAGYFPPY